MPIDIDRIRKQTTVARVDYWPTLGSTNDRAAELSALADVELPLLVVADEQTAGRGRGSNRWWTGTGGLAFSLLVDAATVAAADARSPLVALAAGVAAVEALAPMVPGHRVGIHWPNDVYVDEKKLVGILIEVLAGRRHVIGIGVNTNNSVADAPADIQSRVATLRNITGKVQDQTGVLISLLNRLDATFALLRNDASSLVQQANALCMQRGQHLTLQRSGADITARCVGISADGALLLDLGEGQIEACYSGTLRP